MKTAPIDTAGAIMLVVMAIFLSAVAVIVRGLIVFGACWLFSLQPLGVPVTPEWSITFAVLVTMAAHTGGK